MARKKKEPLKVPGAHQPTDKSVIAETIGRESAAEHTKRNIPVFEEDLKTTHTRHIAFMHTLIKPTLKGGFLK